MSSKICSTQSFLNEKSAEICRDILERESKTPHVIKPDKGYFLQHTGTVYTSWKVHEIKNCVSDATVSADVEDAYKCAQALARMNNKPYEIVLSKWHLFLPNEYVIRQLPPILKIETK